VQLKVDIEKVKQLPEEYFIQPLTKLLIARVKGSNLLQSFYVTLNFVTGGAQE